MGTIGTDRLVVSTLKSLLCFVGISGLSVEGFGRWFIRECDDKGVAIGSVCASSVVVAVFAAVAFAAVAVVFADMKE